LSRLLTAFALVVAATGCAFVLPEPPAAPLADAATDAVVLPDVGLPDDASATTD
jgi:hypothetical protein